MAGIGLALVALAAFILLATQRRDPRPPDEAAALRWLGMVSDPGGTRVVQVEVSNRTDRPLALLPFVQVASVPYTNRAAIPLPSLNTTWVLQAHATRTLGIPLEPPPVRWQLCLYGRPWKGRTREAVADAVEWARAYGWPFSSGRAYHQFATPWIPPADPGPGP